MATRFSRPLPDKITVSSLALVQVVNALNTGVSAVRDLMVTRDDSLTNPIDILERELMNAQSTTDRAEAYAAAHAEAQALVDGTLHNHKRQGGLNIEAVMRLADFYLVTNDKLREDFKAALELLGE